MEKFKTNLTKKEVDLYWNPDNRDVAQISAQIDWVLEIEKRDWGVKNILMYAEKVQISITYEDEAMNNHEEILDVSDWAIDSNLEIGKWCPQELSLDFKRKELSIS